MSALVVRPMLPQDEIFLYDLYSAVRAAEFELVQIPATQKELLIRMQFRAQLSAYSEMYPNSCYHLVLLDSKPVGRLWVAPGDTDLQLVDIAIHPKLQGKGIGTVLVQRLQQEAATVRLPIRCCVFRFNPGSLRFHLRLGFSVIREDQTHHYLEWRPVPLL